MPGKPFEKGNQAAKGHGRPQGSGYIPECQTYAEQKGWVHLIAIAEGQAEFKDSDGKVIRINGGRPTQELSFEALKLVLAYAKGKPPQAFDIGSGGETFFDWLRENIGSRGGAKHGAHGQ